MMATAAKAAQGELFTKPLKPTTATAELEFPSAIHKCAADEDSKYAITSVMVARGTGDEAIACATDGRMAAVCEIEVIGKTPQHFRVPPEVFKNKGKSSIELRNGVWVNPDNDKWGEPQEESDFPPIGTVMTDPPTDGFLLSFSPELLNKMAAAVGGEGYITILVPKPETKGEDAGSVNKPLVVVGESGAGLLMPAKATKPLAALVAQYNRCRELAAKLFPLPKPKLTEVVDEATGEVTDA